MAFKNRIRIQCSVCLSPVGIGEGWTEGPPWVTKCQPCSGKVAAPSAPTIKGTKEGNKAVFKPTSFLGGDLFDSYRRASEGSRFDPVQKANVAPLDRVAKIVTSLKTAGFVVDLDPALASAVQALTAQVKANIEGASERATKVDLELRKRGLYLFPFQATGMKWLAARHGALLADEMGLGKTIQALISLPENAPVLIVGPAVAKGVWARELGRWRPDLKPVVLSGRGNFRWPEAGEAVIVNYDILPAELEGEPLEGTCLISDEAHALKGSKTARTIRFRAISEKVRAKLGRVWLLTATPLLNKPPELWSVFQAAGIAQEAFGSWKQFCELFNGYPGEWGGMVWGTPSPEVADRIRRVALRRQRKEVLPELPFKTWQEVVVDLDPKSKKAIDKAIEFLNKNKPTVWDRLISDNDMFEHEPSNKKTLSGTELESARRAVTSMGAPDFEMLAKARALLATAKIPALVEIVEQFEEQEEPVVVFSAHRAPIDIFKDRPGWAVITGDTSPEARTQIEDAFQAGKLKGIACTIKAGGVAITLTRASQAIFVDLEWTPALNAQAEDRICRIGQTRGCVITNLVARHPLDIRVFELLSQKQSLIGASVEAARVQEVVEPELIEIDFAALQAQARAEARAADKARLEAEKLAAERLAQNAGKREQETENERKKRDEKASEEKKARARERAKAKGWIEEEGHPERHSAETPAEAWAAKSLVQLTEDDPDFAKEENGIGFNKSDGVVGHWLAQELPKGLTPVQWDLAVKLCKKYHGQVGKCPSV